MSLASDVKTVMTADATLMALLTGGVYVGVEEVSRQNTAGAFDANRELKPCALIKLGVETQRGPFRAALSVQTPITIYFYQRNDYDVIDPAMDRTLELLHLAKIGSTTWEVEYESTVNDQRDQALDCPLATMRFVAVRRRL